MRSTVSENLKKYLLGAKVRSLSSLLLLLKSDLRALLGEYMKLSGELKMLADIDESGGDVMFTLSFSASEIYETGQLLQ